MDIKNCFEILELEEGASREEMKQAYKDLVNIWHPDRFAQNPRLKRKAEAKLKEINLAYETAIVYLSSKTEARHDETVGQERGSASTTSDSGHGEPVFERQRENREQGKASEQDKVEAAFEIGTTLILNAGAYLYKSLRGLIASVNSATGADASDASGEGSRREGHRGKGKVPGRRNDHRGRGGMGAGRGPGRGSGKGFRGRR